jgi:Cdc6-like AAA superfamily ATPase
MSIVKSFEDEQMAKINSLDGQISRLTEVLTVDLQTDTAKGVVAMNALLTSLNEPIRRLVDRSSISAKALKESQNLHLLRWLSPVPFSSHHKRHSESRIPCSGQWLLDHDRYLKWRNTSSSSIFLLHGIMGSGKTSLASVVVDSFLQQNSGQTSPAPIAYFYCTKTSAEAERSNPDEIMRSILRQLTISHGSSSTIHERVLQEYEGRQEVARIDGFDTARLQAAECVRLILESTVTNPATIVLDAVDEIQPSSRHVLLSSLIQIVQDSLSVVKIFVTSRDDSNIHALLSDAVAVRIQNEHTRKDMDEFVHRKLSSAIRNRRMLNGVVSDNLKQSLMSALITGAGEM